MAHAAKVVTSIESPCALRCVDIVVMPEGGYGWASYRRDPEDGSGWHSDGWRDAGFATAEQARKAACDSIGWLQENA